MAASWYSQKTHLLTSIRVTLSLLLVATSRSAPLAFSYDRLNSSVTANAFNISGDVYHDNQHLQLTRYEKDSLGRVIYSKQFHLWDINSGKVTDFTTSFSFTINTPNKTHHGDGITFFLAHPNFPLPIPRDGSGIGLLSRDQLSTPNYTNENPFVAVEFDTFLNDWDPAYQHVGIDVNSFITHRNTTQWFSSMDERGYDADVSYNSSSNILSVTFTGYKDNIRIKQHLSCVVNLRDVLPDWVEFGFTSATGFFFEEHTLSSWSFNSSLDFEAFKDETKTGQGLMLGEGLEMLSIQFISLLVTVVFMKFSYGELARATDNFAKEHKIGEGGFGEVYKGFTRDLNNYVAIKKVSQGSNQGVKEYASEVKIISRLRHKNLVQLFGWCHQQNDLLLVYEFVENGSLDSYLFKGKGLLTWT